MNYLAHLFLSPDEPQVQLGGLIADFTRGRLDTLARQYPPRVMRGIELHRKIDRFTDDNHWVQRSKARFPSGYRRFAGILVDILYDHFLSRSWSDYTGRDRLEFIQQVYRRLAEHRQLLPPNLQQLAPRMSEEDWLGSYHDLEVIGFVYGRMASRLGRPTCLDGAIDEVKANYPLLADDFNHFFPQLVDYVRQQGR